MDRIIGGVLGLAAVWVGLAAGLSRLVPAPNGRGLEFGHIECAEVPLQSLFSRHLSHTLSELTEFESNVRSRKTARKEMPRRKVSWF